MAFYKKVTHKITLVKIFEKNYLSAAKKMFALIDVDERKILNIFMVQKGYR